MLNATFGNAAELIIAMAALGAGYALALLAETLLYIWTSFQRRQLRVHVREDGGDGGLFGERRCRKRHFFQKLVMPVVPRVRYFFDASQFIIGSASR